MAVKNIQEKQMIDDSWQMIDLFLFVTIRVHSWFLFSTNNPTGAFAGASLISVGACDI